MAQHESRVASHEEVLELLSDQARKGSVTAAAALERALRALERKREAEIDSAIDRILETEAG